MTRLIKGIACLALLMGGLSGAHAFALLGPIKGDNFPDPWQADGYAGRPQGLGYDLDFDIGGPMFPFEAYRWNTPIITYAFDFTFLRYFGTNGVAAVEEAMAILNALPPASQMTPDLSEFPLDTKVDHSEAATLGLLDLKSYTLSTLLEQLGLTNPERFVWGLRGRETGQGFTNYSVIQLNFDPITIQPSRYVNGVLYNYQIIDDLGPQGDEWASAIEWYQLDPLFQPYSSVAGGVNNSDFQLGSSPSSFISVGAGGLGAGQFYTGLTRDDAGGLRFLLSTNHMVFDNLLPTVLPRSGGSGGSPWAPFLSTNLLGTNLAGLSNIVGIIGTNQTNLVRTALRPGVDKITFQRVSLFGTNFNPVTLRYTDRYLNLNTGRMVKQPVERLVLVPDIIFEVRDVGNIDELVPGTSTRSGTGGWTNNAALNSFLGGVGLGGPGTIVPPVVVTFTDAVPYWLNAFSGGLDSDAFRGFLWGSFDGSSRPPVVYPIYQHPVAPQLSLDYLRRLATGRTRTN